MTVVALLGWMLAVSMATLLLRSCRVRRAQLARIAEAEHELRGPLTALGLALAEASSCPTGWRASLRAELARASCALADLTAARTGLPTPGPSVTVVDLAAVVRHSVSAWTPAAIAAGVDLESVCAGTIPALADPARLAQATGNLIANAIEHGGQRVQVHVASCGGRARIEVSDSGAGVSEPVPVSPRRGHAATRGHGLRVAARVAAQHGGELAVSRAHAGGARGFQAAVVLTLPLGRTG